MSINRKGLLFILACYLALRAFVPSFLPLTLPFKEKYAHIRARHGPLGIISDFFCIQPY